MSDQPRGIHPSNGGPDERPSPSRRGTPAKAAVASVSAAVVSVGAAVVAVFGLSTGGDGQSVAAPLPPAVTSSSPSASASSSKAEAPSPSETKTSTLRPSAGAADGIPPEEEAPAPSPTSAYAGKSIYRVCLVNGTADGPEGETTASPAPSNRAGYRYPSCSKAINIRLDKDLSVKGRWVYYLTLKAPTVPSDPYLVVGVNEKATPSNS